MARRGLGEQLAQILGRAVGDGARSWLRSRTGSRSSTPGRGTTGRTPARRTPGGGTARGGTVPAAGGSYPGDFSGVPDLRYAANPDGRPDPGEIVWTWVPYEEDHSQGKDRPVLLVGRDGGWLLALMLTSKDHDRDAAQESRRGRHWQDIGSGAWDRAGRPSEVRLDRVIRVDPAAVRREGATLDRARFDAVAAAVRALG
ncbi:growth inhibitor PemK [Phycicoccus sp. Root563]|uniref:type II toxin-antitoxin system PemK/MazF family toxin n=1 Tax=Phycicoccus sp. Root563 TaxID=1736562 RepID=UPI00070328A0|nr:type II toxin-antitoxin system PemK/MazF family toxin [Phycicoccus sp. Root563]KQZ87541.1 growth inhibitor PemK [Phycicoccus sp. Root563]